jgi:thiamine transport system substrate-binding protein
MPVEENAEFHFSHPHLPDGFFIGWKMSKEKKMKKAVRLMIICLTSMVLFSHLAVAGGPTNEITVMTHDSFSVSKDVVALFETRYNCKIRFLKAGDAGAALNQAILSKNNPLADLFFGVDNTFMSRALDAGIFEPYASPLLGRIRDDLKLDPENRLLPVDFGDVCLNYDKRWFVEKKLKPPARLEDLVKPAYKSLTVVENPATSSPGLAFLLATVGHFGENGYLDFWKKMRANDVLVTNGWKEAYWGSFSAASKGDRPIVVSYASSPPAEVYYAKTPPDQAPTAAVTNDGTCFRQIEFAGILKGSKKLDLARKLMDFMLDAQFQADIPLQMFVFPAGKSVPLPEVFTKYAKIADHPVTIPHDEISDHRDKWIEGWTETVLR